jgi:hypothetical protein
MSTNSWPDEIGPHLRTLQIVIAALTTGCLIFMVIALFLVQIRPGAAAGNEVPPMITYLALGFAGVAVVARIVLPRMIESSARKSIADGTWQFPAGNQNSDQLTERLERLGDAGKLLAVLNTRTIIAGAILEGSAFFALVAYLVEHSPLALAAAIVMILGVALNFPTVSGVTRWIEDQLAAIEQARQFGP